MYTQVVMLIEDIFHLVSSIRTKPAKRLSINIVNTIPK
jgi:hypothetical protein